MAETVLLLDRSCMYPYDMLCRLAERRPVAIISSSIHRGRPTICNREAPGEADAVCSDRRQCLCWPMAMHMPTTDLINFVLA